MWDWTGIFPSTVPPNVVHSTIVGPFGLQIWLFYQYREEPICVVISH